MSAWLQAFHVIGLILWMGGLLHLARHLGYHAEIDDPEIREKFADWESTTYYATVLPGLLLALGTGLWSMFSLGFGHYLTGDAWGGTFHMKLLMVAILIGVDQVVHFKMRSLHQDGEGNRGLFMALHGVVAFFFIVIVIIVQTRILA